MAGHTHLHKILHNIIGGVIAFGFLLFIRYLVVKHSTNETVKQLAQNG